MKQGIIIPLILCGGSGTRLWPLSRPSFPKQFIPLISDSKFSLLQETVLRIMELENIDKPIFICHENHRFLVAEQMREINIVPKSIILEPKSKNTCPSITLGAIKAYELDKESKVIVLSSDHLIRDKEKFLEAINNSIKLADLQKLVTFGIVPSSPETGYGYIKSEKKLFNDKIKSFKINKFIEKPSLNVAKKLIKDKRITWNSGIFTFKTSQIIKEIKNLEPDLFEKCRSSLLNGFKDLEFQRIEEESFEKCKESSFDISIMEKTKKGVVIPIDVEWSDVGSWNSLWENEIKNDDGNVLSGNVFVSQVKNSYIKSDNRLVVANDVDNLIVVETDDVILISNKNKSQKIKNIVNHLQEENFSEAKEHRRIYRPWGNYDSISEGEMWQVKKIEVKPSAQLSMQKHFHRAEHWVVVKGLAKVIIDEKESFLEENQSIFIPKGSKHRLSNVGKTPLILIEVQSGNYLGEDDIVRFQDDYGRN